MLHGIYRKSLIRTNDCGVAHVGTLGKKIAQRRRENPNWSITPCRTYDRLKRQNCSARSLRL
jgi:hypothetical protein